jgi:hypothetical protein
MVTLDYYEIIKRISEKKKKKLIPKGDKIFVNVIPYIEYFSKYDIEKNVNMRNFKLIQQEGVYWLRIFCSDELYIMELPKPYEKTIEYDWTESTAGGARYIRDQEKKKIVENPYWPINPQYLLKFENNITMKIILRKQNGHFSNEETKVGLILTKPNFEDSIGKSLKNVKTKGKFNKNDQILRLLESTDKILGSKVIDYDKILRKLMFNSSEWVVESSYCNHFCASLYKEFNKIDSPIILIPTLENPNAKFNYKMSSKIFIIN